RAQQSLLQKEIPSSFTSLSAKTDEIIIAKEAISCRYRQDLKSNHTKILSTKMSSILRLSICSS
ncbi:MAG: hypothetical protein E6063_06390, partial [Atopobium sp.]|nr:hypothetical protein [Atopobium sp.]